MTWPEGREYLQPLANDGKCGIKRKKKEKKSFWCAELPLGEATAGKRC